MNGSYQNEDEDAESVILYDVDETETLDLNNCVDLYCLSMIKLQMIIDGYENDYQRFKMNAVHSKKHLCSQQELLQNIRLETATYCFLCNQLITCRITKYDDISTKNVRALHIDERWVTYWPGMK